MRATTFGFWGRTGIVQNFKDASTFRYANRFLSTTNLRLEKKVRLASLSRVKHLQLGTSGRDALL